MGTDIGGDHFTSDDFVRFRRRLVRETRHARAAYLRGDFADDDRVAGYELEAWLVDENCRPVPNNVSFLARLASPLVVPELSRFNVEINGTPQRLGDRALSLLEAELAATWERCLHVARADHSALIAIGTLPTLRENDLSLTSMSPYRRYSALNEQILLLRGGRPLTLDIVGLDRLCATHADVMLEAATTSFQVHLQAPASEIARIYNASLVLAAPLVALTANSPFLFEHALWHETRIPLFEQAVDCNDQGHPESPRVTFGSDYLGPDPTAFFAENLLAYAVLLPFSVRAPLPAYAHVRLHNGTIWRWNRLLIGFNAVGVPHFRVEHRVMPAGPSLVDMIANAAFYYGAVHFLSRQPIAVEKRLPFAMARRNFYQAARHGLEAPLVWFDGEQTTAGEVLQRQLLPAVAEGLAQLAVDAGDRTRYLAVIAGRLESRQNGAAWQLAHYAKYHDFVRLTADYLAHQRRMLPVHEWPL